MANVHSILSEFEDYCALALKNIDRPVPSSSRNIYNFSICFNTYIDNLKMYGNNIRNHAIRILSESEEEDVMFLMEELFKVVKKWIDTFISTHNPVAS